MFLDQICTLYVNQLLAWNEIRLVLESLKEETTQGG